MRHTSAVITVVMIHTPIVRLFLLGLGLRSVRAQITVVEETRRPSCNGSLQLSVTGSNKTLIYVRGGELNRVTDINRTRISKARVEGCGCVRIYSRQGGRGKSVYLRPPETVQEGEKQFVKIVRSFKIVRCRSSDSILEAVVVSVLAAVLLVGLGCVIFIKRKRLFGRAESDSVEVTDIENIPDCSTLNKDSPSEEETRPEDRVIESQM